MTDTERLQMSRQIWSGARSRNRDFDLFCEAAPRRVLDGTRRVRALLRDCAVPRARVHWCEAADGSADVAVERADLRYRRRALLTPWEARLFLEQAALQLGEPFRSALAGTPPTPEGSGGR